MGRTVDAALACVLVLLVCVHCETVKDENSKVTDTSACECKNGFCEKDEAGKLECKCQPEYGKFNSKTECYKCNCGKGANCTWGGFWGPTKSCLCRKGYVDVQGTCKGDCKGSPCQNGGTCRVVGNEITCDCVPPYSGDNCEERKEGPCYPNPCQNAATCEMDNGKGKCKCKSPYTGDFCHINQCEKNPCKNGGICDVVNGKVNCTCKDPYTGDLCDENQCDKNPCKNGGICGVVNGKVNCNCKDPYTGDLCDKNQCDKNPCKNGGICDVVNGKVNCKCKDPYTGDLCDKIDYCAFHPCQNGGNCSNGNYTFECTCTGNYGGKDCLKNVWCEKYGHYMCGKEKCQYNETIGRGFCVCENGKIFHEPSKTCVVDYCTSNPCHNGGICRNANYNFECTCTGNYGGKDCSENIWCDKYGQYLCGKEKCKYSETIGRGYCVCEKDKIFHDLSKTCVVLDPCSPNPCKNNGHCANDDGKYKCFCKDGYRGVYCEIDPDPCYPNPCKNNGQCANVDGKAKCFCRYGYTGDECGIEPDPCYPNLCKNNGYCANVDGIYKCSCKDGYVGDLCEIDCRYMIASVLLLVLLSAICLCSGCCLFRMTHNLLRDSVGYKTLPSMP